MAYLGNFVIGMCGAAGIGKLRAFPIQMILTHVKSDFATYATNLLSLGDFVTEIQNLPS